VIFLCVCERCVCVCVSVCMCVLNCSSRCVAGSFFSFVGVNIFKSGEEVKFS